MVDNKDYFELAKELDACDSDVSSWEAEFLDSVLKRCQDGMSVTSKQAAVLDEMEAKYLD